MNVWTSNSWIIVTASPSGMVTVRLVAPDVPTPCVMRTELAWSWYENTMLDVVVSSSLPLLLHGGVFAGSQAGSASRLFGSSGKIQASSSAEEAQKVQNSVILSLTDNGLRDTSIPDTHRE